MELTRASTLSTSRSAGFGLVEIMVAVVIGMLAVIVMLQVFAVSEERRRTTTNGGDAQSNGVITFYQLQRDIEQAGYGFTATQTFNCTAKWKVSGTDIGTAVHLAPVTINPSTSVIPAGDPNTDTLLIMYGNTNGEPQGNKFSGTGTTYTVQMPSSFTQGDHVIAAPDSCSSDLVLDTVTAVDTHAGTVQVTTGGAGTALYNLGPSPSILAYRVHNGNLTVCDYLANDCGKDSDKDNDSVWAPVASNIVSLRAQYGIDTTGMGSTPWGQMDGIVDWIDESQTTPTLACGWMRISAIRLAIVARSAQYEKTAVTTSAPSWDGASGTHGVSIDLTENPDGTANSNWQHYRYRTFEGVIPIRNVVFMGAVTGC